jgi:glycosyltransferase involved in cell wall biosynthesis
MRIAYYIHHTAISAGGIFTYSIGILRQIIKSDEIEKVVIITSEEINERLNEFINNPKVKISIVDRKKLSIKIRYTISYLIYNLAIIFRKYLSLNKPGNQLKIISKLINPYRNILESEDVSIFHVPVQYSPIYECKIPVIITMHDLQEYHFPEFFTPGKRRHRVINNNKAIYDSDHIIVSFRHVKDDIIQYFKIDGNKISICPPPFAESWFISKDECSWNDLSEKYGIRKDYILYPAATWKHKNHLTLIRALKMLVDDGIEIELVCTGNKTDHYKNIREFVEELQLSEKVHFLGIVTEEELIGLYKNTRLVVIPTLYEAGSGPLYEAMQYQVPVICSNVTSLPETMNNAEFIFNPNDTESIANKIKSGLKDVNFRKRNIKNSKERIEQFKQVNYSLKFLEAYNQFSS